MFCLCAWLSDRLYKRGVSELNITVVSAVLGILTFVAQYFAVPQEGRMADFTKAYYVAGRVALVDQVAFTELLSKGATGFVNLPIVAFVFTPFSFLPKPVALVLFFGLGLFASVYVWRILVRWAELNGPQSALMAFLMIGSGPVAYGVIVGNTSQMVMIAVLWGVIFMMRGKDWGAGVLFAAAALIKPALLLLGVYALLRGRWRVSLAGMAVCVVAAFLSITVFGWSLHRIWLEQTIFPALQGLIMAHNVQSIGGVVGRLFVGDLYLGNWDMHPVAPVVATIIKIGQTITIAIVAGSVVLLARKARPQQTLAMEVSFILFLILLLPNISWNHYYVWAFLPLSLLLPSVFPLNKKNPETWLILAAAGMIAQPVAFWHGSSDWVNGLFARLIVSLPFVGAVLLLAISVRRVLLWDHLRDPGSFKLTDR